MNDSAQGSGGRLDENIVQFGRVLRRAGLPVGPAAIVEAIRAVEVSGIASRDDFYWTLHAVLVKKREERAVFDEAFRLFWRSRQLVEKMLAMLSPAATKRPKEPPRAAASRVAQALFAEQNRERPPVEEVELDARLTVSGEEVLKTRDFAQMTAEELAAAERRLARLAMPLDTVPTRRFTAAPRGRIDARRTLRAAMRSGGRLVLPKFRQRRERHPPIVALVDISGSMSRYSRVLLHFLHALSARRRVHVFLFGTRLTNVTRSLRMKDPDAALAACSGAVADWSGGTRIAAALAAFNRDWSRRVLGEGAIVLLVTDGLEREGGEELAREADRLHRSCRRLIWLNPLLRFDGFEAKARGIRALLPHVDEFRAVHNLDAVADLVTALSGDGRRADPRRFREAAA
ncbi:vWA domain-containing protein [Prosthecomicrobium pneumaticum]|uniref:VWFA domain-containing protein n=1 Tax=Prosthecomicrobium pneumaticum TaxID=81895 RepID=A0A7W9FPN9_9HYPH|nr:VWA domain-containing protein [Prosthecomicrobium pneumaticum]MBB5754486.1 hypothetical protein [Prosthecomicrobium pneumaticum]